MPHDYKLSKLANSGNDEFLLFLQSIAYPDQENVAWMCSADRSDQSDFSTKNSSKVQKHAIYLLKYAKLHRKYASTSCCL